MIRKNIFIFAGGLSYSETADCAHHDDTRSGKIVLAEPEPGELDEKSRKFLITYVVVVPRYVYFQ